MDLFLYTWPFIAVLVAIASGWFVLKEQRHLTLKDIGMCVLLGAIYPLSIIIMAIALCEHYADRPLFVLKKVEKETK